MNNLQKTAKYGFPALLILLVLCAIEYANTGASGYRKMLRNNNEQAAEKLLMIAKQETNNSITKNTIERNNRLNEIKHYSSEISEKTARILADTINNFSSKKSRTLKNPSSLGGFFSALGLLPKENPQVEPAPPPSFIIENKKEIQKLTYGKNCYIKIYDNSNKQIWSSTKREITSDNFIVSRVKCNYIWAGQKGHWMIESGIKPEKLPNVLDNKNIAQRILSNPEFASLSNGKRTLALADAKGNVLFSIPANSFPILREIEEPKVWQEIDKGLHENRRMCFINSTDVKGPQNYNLYAQVLHDEKDNITWAISEIPNKPFISLVFFTGLVVSCLGTILSFKKSSTRSNRKEAPPPTNNYERSSLSNIKLIKKDGVGISDSADVVLAEIDDEGQPHINTHYSRQRQKNRVKQYRESNLKKLRRLYFENSIEPEVLQKRVKSDILKNLLREVGGRSQSKNKEGDKNHV
jgi:hypothetical protein